MSSPPIPPDRWRQIEALFYEGLDMTPAQARAWLAARDDVDAALREGAQQLLDALHQVGGLFEVAVGQAAADAFTDAGSAAIGRRIGPYTLVAELGHGGMGSVYLAQRSDEYCDRQRLSVAERLRLFRLVCGAVHYAHQRLVIASRSSPRWRANRRPRPRRPACGARCAGNWTISC
jgi:serine/threonine-protein kinase